MRSLPETGGVPRTCQLLRLACLVVLSGLAVAVRAQSASRCLTPEVEHALGPLVEGGGLQSALGQEFRLTRGDSGGNQIELEIQDQAQHPYGLVLALPESRSGPSDGAGLRFAYYLDPAAASNPGAKAALLAAGAIIDRAVPDTALQPCSQQPAGSEADVDNAPAVAPPAEAGAQSANSSQPRPQRRYPLALALGSAIAQIAVVLVAILYGVWAVASLPAVDAAQSDDGAPE